ncbi:hypothetical protein J6590_058370 [Homalodisca vitripennis]|nr:hypothetical protein J6590_058370 [Homalodisca vitripennis]
MLKSVLLLLLVAYLVKPADLGDSDWSSHSNSKEDYNSDEDLNSEEDSSSDEDDSSSNSEEDCSTDEDGDEDSSSNSEEDSDSSSTSSSKENHGIYKKINFSKSSRSAKFLSEWRRSMYICLHIILKWF